MQWYEAEVAALERANASRIKKDHPPVFYGGSSIRLWDSLAEDIGPCVVNLGFGGATLEACDYFFARLVPALQPRSLLLYAGDNDLGDGRPVEAVLQSFGSLADKVTASLGSIPLGFVSIKPSPARFPLIDRIDRVNQEVKREIEARRAGYYVDVYSTMLGPDGKPERRFFGEDGLHLSREGYQLWTRLLEPHRNQIFTS